MFDLGRILVRLARATGTSGYQIKAANAATIKKYLKPGVIREAPSYVHLAKEEPDGSRAGASCLVQLCFDFHMIEAKPENLDR